MKTEYVYLDAHGQKTDIPNATVVVIHRYDDAGVLVESTSSEIKKERLRNQSQYDQGSYGDTASQASAERTGTHKGKNIWICPNDETENTGAHCMICGSARPRKWNKHILLAGISAICVLAVAIIYLANASRQKDILSPPVSSPVITVQQADPPVTIRETESAEVTIELPKILNPLSKLQLDDTFYLGSYEQDNDLGNGMETIAWLVLARDGDYILAISQYALDCIPYHTTDDGITWKTSYVRKWLNESFYNTAFSTDEKAQILTSQITTERNPRYTDVFPGSNTEDKIFLLSIKEIEMYLTPRQENNEENQHYTNRRREARLCEPTPYAVAQGAYVRKDTNGSWWWLRNPGEVGNNASCILSYGDILYAGESVNSGRGTVRPAMWISVK